MRINIPGQSSLAPPMSVALLLLPASGLAPTYHVYKTPCSLARISLTGVCWLLLPPLEPWTGVGFFRLRAVLGGPRFPLPSTRRSRAAAAAWFDRLDSIPFEATRKKSRERETEREREREREREIRAVVRYGITWTSDTKTTSLSRAWRCIQDGGVRIEEAAENSVLVLKVGVIGTTVFSLNG